jgi:hypothetical protein
MSSGTGQRQSSRFAPTEFPQVHPQWACPVYRRFGRALVRALVCLLGTCRCHSLAFASACRCTVPCVASNGRADTPGRSKTPVQKERSHGYSTGGATVHPQRRHPNRIPAGSRSIDTRPRAACSWRTTGPSISLNRRFLTGFFLEFREEKCVT